MSDSKAAVAHRESLAAERRAHAETRARFERLLAAADAFMGSREPPGAAEWEAFAAALLDAHGLTEEPAPAPSSPTVLS